MDAVVVLVVELVDRSILDGERMDKKLNTKPRKRFINKACDWPLCSTSLRSVLDKMPKAQMKMDVARIFTEAAAEALAVDEAGDVKTALKNVKRKASDRIDATLR